MQKGEKNNNTGGTNIPHTLVWMWHEEGRGGRGRGFLDVSFSTPRLDQRVIGRSGTALQGRGIKADDTSQRSLERNKINVQSRLFIKGWPVLRS